MPKHRSGYLYKRGGVYQLEYSINGKRFKQSLKVSKKSEAEKLRDKIMKPLTVADESEALSSIKTRMDTKEAELQAIDVEKNPPLEIEKAWEAYLNTKNCKRL